MRISIGSTWAIVMRVSSNYFITLCEPRNENLSLRCGEHVIESLDQCTKIATSEQQLCSSNVARVQQQCNISAETMLGRCNSDAAALQKQCSADTSLQCDLNEAAMRIQCHGAVASVFLQCGSTAGLMQLQCSTAATAMQIRCQMSADEAMQQQCGHKHPSTFIEPKRESWMAQLDRGEGSVTAASAKTAAAKPFIESTTQPVQASENTAVLVVKVGIFHTQGAGLYALTSLLIMVHHIRVELPVSWKIVLELPTEGDTEAHPGYKWPLRTAPPIGNLFTGDSLNAMAQAIGVELRRAEAQTPFPYERTWDICIGRTLHLAGNLRWSRGLVKARLAWRREIDEIIERGLTEYNSNSTLPCASWFTPGVKFHAGVQDWDGDMLKELHPCSQITVGLLKHYFLRIPSWVAEVAKVRVHGEYNLTINVLGETGSPIFHQSVLENEMARNIIGLLRLRPPEVPEDHWPQQVRHCAYYFMRENNKRPPKRMLALMREFVIKRGLSCVYVNTLDNSTWLKPIGSSDVEVILADKTKWRNPHELFFASIAPLFIIDQSSHWGDHILFHRSLQDLPSVILPWFRQKHGALECDSGRCADCIFRRAWCFDSPTILDMESSWDGCAGKLMKGDSYSQEHPIDLPGSP